MNPDRADPPGVPFMESQPVKPSFSNSRRQRLKNSRGVHRVSQAGLVVLGSVAWAAGLLNVWQALIALAAAMLVTLWVAVIAGICVEAAQEINNLNLKGLEKEDEAQN